MIKILHNLHSFVLSQKCHFFTDFFGENIQKIITSVPDGKQIKDSFSQLNFRILGLRSVSKIGTGSLNSTILVLHPTEENGMQSF
jgi:hypothetical protein